MQASPRHQGRLIPIFMPINFICTVILCMMMSNVGFAAVIDLHGNQVINKSVKYKNAVLNLSDSRFTVSNGATLEIENSTINITISKENPYFINLKNSILILRNNRVNVSTTSALNNEHTKPEFQLINIQRGSFNIESNNFISYSQDAPLFLEITEADGHTLNILNNKITAFQDGIYLFNSSHVIVIGNTFESVASTNIFNIGDSNTIQRNIFILPGNLKSGNAIEIVNSSGLDISDNIIAGAANYGIYLGGCQNSFIYNNKISDGASFAIYIGKSSIAAKYKYLENSTLRMNDNDQIHENRYITIRHNYISQNKYGLAGGPVDHLTVANNIFIQRFANSALRQYWTDNTILLSMTTNLFWTDNLYKEAFTQEVPGNNQGTFQFITFPQNGGVVLP